MLALFLTAGVCAAMIDQLSADDTSFLHLLLQPKVTARLTQSPAGLSQSFSRRAAARPARCPGEAGLRQPRYSATLVAATLRRSRSSPMWRCSATTPISTSPTKKLTPSAEAREVVRRPGELIDVVISTRSRTRLPPRLALCCGSSSDRTRISACSYLTPTRIRRWPAARVRIPYSAVLRFGERRVEVITTDDREVALSVLRLLRTREVVICFAAGHGEYDIDNFEFHTHFEGSHSHSHDISGTDVVQMEQHGLGRLRRAIEKLGLVARKVSFATGQPIPMIAP